VVKIRVEDRWYEYPDDQIKSWDSEGNIEWSDKIHWKFLRGRPQKGDEFVYGDSKYRSFKKTTSIKIIMLSTGDFAGSGFKIKQSVESLSEEYEVITIVKKKHKYGYDIDFILDNKNHKHIQHLINQCDIIHFKGDELPNRNWNGLKIPDDKKIIITVGGSGFRRNVDDKNVALEWHQIDEYLSVTDFRTTITPDLNYPEFKSIYTPHTLDTNNSQYTWIERDIPIIQHSPSMRKKKGTDDIILPVLNELKDEGFSFDIQLLENLKNDDCVKMKMKGSIFIDQISDTGFYGMSTIESIQFGIPTIAYISEMSIEQSNGIINDDCPIISVKSKNDLKDRLRYYLTNKNKLKDLSLKTKEYANRVHSFESVGKKWIDIYTNLYKEKIRENSPSIYNPKILVSLFVYNEIDYIETFIKYYKSQNCNFCFIDNYSDDGTYEYLKDNGFDVRRVDTNGSFDMIKLQKNLLKFIHDIKPEWVLYTGADTFILFDDTIENTIDYVELNGFNQISTEYLKPYNTGETFRLPLQNNYFFMEIKKPKIFLSKYNEDIHFNMDDIVINNPNVYNTGVLINYGDCKPSEYRTMIYNRRSKAWTMGMDRKIGTHYIEGKEKKWIWDKNKLTDIRKTEYYKYIEKIIE